MIKRSITVNETNLQYTGCIEIEVPIEMLAEFKIMVTRAINTWQNPSREISEFAATINGNYDLVHNAYHPRPSQTIANNVIPLTAPIKN